MHNPTLIPALLRDTSVKKGLIYRELRKALPCRIGIEFEMGANFRSGFRKKYNPKATDEDIAKFYGVQEVRCDDMQMTLDQALRRQRRILREMEEARQDVGRDEPAGDADKIIESRVSIKDFSQLAGLYKFMQDLPEFCAMHEGGGIHIHIDMSMFPYTNKAKEKEIHRWITHRLDDVGNLFPKYKGTYNSKKVGIRSKATWVNISSKRTLEFRTPPLTFDYYTLMTWIVGIVKFRNKLIHECQLKKDWNPNSNIVKLDDEVWIEVPADQIGQPIPGEVANGYLNGGYQLYSDDHGHTWSIRNTSNTDYWST